MAILVLPNYQSDPSRKQSEKNKGHEDSGITVCQNWSIYVMLPSFSIEWLLHI
jgi:hypothetical protein